MHSIDDADQVHVQNPAPIVERVSRSANPGVVAQDVDFAEGRKGFFGSSVDGSGIGNVAHDPPYFRPGA